MIIIKTGRRHERTFQRRPPSGQRENALSIAPRRGNTNQKHQDGPPHTCRNGQKQNRSDQQVLARPRGAAPRAPLVGTRASAATAENSMEVPQKLKTRITIGSRNATNGDLPKGQGTLIRKDARTPVCFILLRRSFQVISTPSAEPALALAAPTGPPAPLRAPAAALPAAAPGELASVPGQMNDTHDGTLLRCKTRMNSGRTQQHSRI